MDYIHIRYCYEILESNIAAIGTAFWLLVFFSVIYSSIGNSEPKVEIECIVKSWSTSPNGDGPSKTVAICGLDNGNEVLVTSESSLREKVGDRVKAKVKKSWLE